MTARRASRGLTLIELLVSLVITAIGLMGIMQLYLRGQTSELESYQRAQALVLLGDMVNRLDANRAAADCYAITDAATGAPFAGEGNAATFSCAGAGTTATRAVADDDLAEWDAVLKGATEVLAGANAGGVRGARGCVWSDAAGDVFTIAVAWQGRAPLTAPANPCGQGEYGNENLRRVVMTTLRMADLN